MKMCYNYMKNPELPDTVYHWQDDPVMLVLIVMIALLFVNFCAIFYCYFKQKENPTLYATYSRRLRRASIVILLIGVVAVMLV